jgi:tetratricopeptide (TPR) repeat protein/transcriptional regulator with XRE-family HTH domain
VFGDLVRGHRRRVGLSQEELAEKSGISVRGLRKIESNQIDTPRPVTVRLLAEAFGLVGDDRERFVAAAAPAGPKPRRSVPAQLPADIAGFTGRADQLRRLDAILSAEESRQPGAVVVVAITGTAGAGKTALAVHWAHQVRHQFADGQLYVNLRGFDPAGALVSPTEVVRGFLDALDVPAARIPEDLDAQAALYRTLMSDRRMLIVLDNARDAGQVRPLLPGTPGCLVVVTSRHHLSSLVAADGAHPVALGLLPPDEARQLLARRLGTERVAADGAAVDEIIARCAQLPLALVVAGARAATHPEFPLHRLAAELRDTRDRLDALAGDDPATDVRAVFSWSYRTLSNGAARLFRLLGLHPGPDIGEAAAGSLAGVPAEEIRRLLAELTRAHLIIEHKPGRYVFHDLLRAYAAEQSRLAEPIEQLHAAIHRMLDHYLHTAHTAAMLLNPGRDPITVAPARPGVTPEPLADDAEAMAWFGAEHAVLAAAVAYAAGNGWDTHAWQLAWTHVHFLDRRGHWHDWAAMQRSALSAATRLADPAALAVSHRLLALAEIQLGRYDDARANLRQALDLYHRSGDHLGQAHTHNHLGMAYDRQGHTAAALDHTEQALALFRASRHSAGQALALNNVGWLRALLGEYEQALAPCEQALALQQELGNRDDEGATWDSLGYVHHHLGHRTESLDCYQRALDLRRELGDRYGEAVTLCYVGDAHLDSADPAAAANAWRRALAILEDLHHPDADQVRDKLTALRRPERRTPTMPDPTADPNRTAHRR